MGDGVGRSCFVSIVIFVVSLVSYLVVVYTDGLLSL
jgi:hypothetical protein